MEKKNEQKHHINLTSAELASLWTSYMTEIATQPVLKYFHNTVEDLEAKQTIDYALQISTKHSDIIVNLFRKENYPIPIGFSDKDVNLHAPRLYSDSFMLYLIRNLGKAGLSANGMAFSMSARKDVREFYHQYFIDAAKVEDAAKEVLLSKGLFVRPPYIATPKQADFVENQGFLRGWFGERRTLTANEISHIFMNHTNNAAGKALLIGFAQTTKSKELKNHFVRGIELAGSILETLRRLLEESSLPSPMTWDTEVNDSTVAPFSDRLMMFHLSSLNGIGLGNIGGSLALSLRRDIAAKYLKMIKDIGVYSEDGINIMIKNGWFERPPQAINREHLSK